MTKIPFSRLAPPCALLLITLIDFAIAINDIIKKNTATGIFIIAMGVLLGYVAIKTLLNARKNYK